MLLKSLRLHNIRSYDDQVIDFPEGIVLLSGGIGCGKSSILLAIEFSLFGLLRGTNSGKELLRHGAQQGFVTLTFEVEQNEYTITRFLKNSNGAVAQTASTITKNGARKDMTPGELKSYLLTVLGYPQALLTKGKGLIYRYTVYTPQEAMKQILEEDADVRLDTLRKIFNIDKYKTIKKNALCYMRILAHESRTYTDQTRELPALERRYNEHKTEQSRRQSELDEAETAYKQLAQKKEWIKAEYVRCENEREDYQKKISSIAHLEAKRRFQEQRLAVLEKEYSELLDSIKKLEAERIPSTAPSPQNVSEILANMKTIEQEIGSRTLERGKLLARKEQKQSVKNRVSNMSTCPTCLQTVDEAHKATVFSLADTKLAEIAAACSSFEQEILCKRNLQGELEEALKSATRAQEELALRSKRDGLLEERRKRAASILFEKQSLETEVLTYAQEHDALKKNVGAANIEEKFQAAKKSYDAFQVQERLQAIALAGLKEKLLLSITLAGSALQNLNEKKEIAEKLQKTERQKKWFADIVIPLVDQIEVQVFSAIHNTFSSIFSQFALSLLDEENFSARLDETFPPIVQQNGYDSDYSQLSGGERTALALAYRLGLNCVVNSLITSIKTKDLLILDEPTDGFSSAQLEKVRDVLTGLQLRQIVIVSHENKVETFVDHVIRISKEGNHSRITMPALTALS